MSPGAAAGKMHPDEVDIDQALVRQLVAAQFPPLRDLAIRAVRSTGTVNAIFRLGDDLCIRLPRHERWTADLEKELRWLGPLGAGVTLGVPEPRSVGEPGGGYPFRWAIYRWLDGETYAADRIDDEEQAAVDLARFVTELRRIDIAGAPPSGRLPLRQLDEATTWAIRALDDGIDAGIDGDAVTAVWEHARQGPAWEGTAVWRHCDLLPPNLLVDDGQLRAVIDFGVAGVGDPAADVIAAWSVFGAVGRARFRTELDIDDETWIRARGYALHQALLIIPYYAETNPDFAAMARRTVAEVLADAEVG
jgi:aminoglycoside phosphotransferase (APT) family kinase protein